MISAADRGGPSRGVFDHAGRMEVAEEIDYRQAEDVVGDSATFAAGACDCPGGPRRFHPRGDSALTPTPLAGLRPFVVCLETNSPTVNHLQGQTVEVEKGVAAGRGRGNAAPDIC